MKKSVAIQGIEGSFHHIVSQIYFEDSIEVQPYLSFNEVVESLTSKTTDVAVMALENSIAGSIIPNYAHIDDQNLHITGEFFLEIAARKRMKRLLNFAGFMARKAGVMK